MSGHDMQSELSESNRPNSSTDRPCVWLLLDGRPGHQNQVLGLADALQRIQPLHVETVNIRGVSHGLMTGAARDRRLPSGRPNAIIAAGHSTHLPLLILGRRFAARTVLLMKSTLPYALFDACLVPDVYNFRAVPQNVILTTGVLNRIQRSQHQDASQRLVLIGGPSKHHAWDGPKVLKQLEHILESKPSGHWAIATSRRTPAVFVDQLQLLQSDRIRLVPAESVGPEWLPQQFARCGEVWVTGESVSMLYEAVTSGAAVGMLELPRIRSNKATRCIDMLLDLNAVTLFTNYMADGVLKASDLPLNEADRCARELLSRQIVPQIVSAGPSAKVA